MSNELVNLLLVFCYAIILSIIVGIICFALFCVQAKRLKTIYITADTVQKERKKFVKPVRIALVSDLHMPKTPPSLNSVIGVIEKGNPDFVVIAGDLCNEKKLWDKAAEFVGELAKRTNCKVFVVLGNHDIDDGCEKNPALIKEYIEKIESADSRVRVLVDRAELAECNGTGRELVFCGLNDYKHSNKNAALAAFMGAERIFGENSKSELILLAHNPDSLIYLPNTAKPTVGLFGHTHGGQVWLPFNFEFRFLRKDKLPQKGYKYGLHSYEGRFPIYITSGVGCTFLPIRFRTSAEVVFIDV